MTTRLSQMRAHTVRKTIAKAIHAFSQGLFAESWQLVSALEPLALSHNDLKRIHKVLTLLIFGEFFGYHNLCQVFDTYHLAPHQWYRFWKTCSTATLVTFVDAYVWLAFQERLLALCQKSAATWSRMTVTLVIDSSMYKQIFSLGHEVPEFDKFFSGQYHAPVYGFRLTVIGMVIGKRFSPIQCSISSKAHKDLDVAKALLAEVKDK